MKNVMSSFAKKPDFFGKVGFLNPTSRARSIKHSYSSVNRSIALQIAATKFSFSGGRASEILSVVVSQMTWIYLGAWSFAIFWMRVGTVDTGLIIIEGFEN
jgi:hypothetical protein